MTTCHPDQRTVEQLNEYDQPIGRHEKFDTSVLILDGDRVDLAAADALNHTGIDYRIIENKKHTVNSKHILGSSADIHTLKCAGIQSPSPSSLATTTYQHLPGHLLPPAAT